MQHRQIIDFDIEKYIATSSQFDHPGTHMRVHNAINAVNWELGQIRTRLLNELGRTTLQYTPTKFKRVLMLEQHLNELDLYLSSIGRRIKNLPLPRRRNNRTQLDGFKGKQGSVSDALRRLRNQIKSIQTILGGIKIDFQKQQNHVETFEMMSQIDEPFPTDLPFEQNRDIFNAGIVLVWGVLVLWKKRKGKKGT